MADLDVAVRLKFLTDGDRKIKDAAKNFAAFGKSVNQLSGRAAGRFSGDLNKAWHASVKLGGALDKDAKAASKTATGLRAIGAGARGIDRTRAAVDRLTKSTHALGAAEKKVRLGAAASGGGVVAAGALGGAMAKRKAALREGFAEAASRVSPGAGYLIGAGGAVALGAGIGGTAAAGVGVAALATDKAISREAAFADIQKKVNLEAGESWAMLDRKVRRVSVSLGMAYEDAASIFAQGGQGNIATRDLEAFATLAAKTATAWDIGAKEAAQMFTEVKAQTGKTIPDLERFADKVNGLGDVSAAAEKDIGAMAQRAMAAMQATGIGEDQALAMMTALRGVGMQDEVAARFLTAFSSKLRTASSLSKDAQKAFEELGLSGKAIEQGMQTRPMETILNLLDRISKAKNAVGSMKSILGGEWFDEGLRMAQATPEIVRLLEFLASGKWRGSMDRAMEIDLGTTEAKLKQLKESILDIAATAAKPIVLPWLSDVADKWKAAADRFREAQQRSEETRALAKPVGRSMADYEREHGLDRPIRNPGPAMFARIEGTTPHLARTMAWGKSVLDASQFEQVAKKATGEANDLFSALQNLDTTVHPKADTSIVTQLNEIEIAAQRAAGAMRALQNFGAPGAGVRVNPTLTGAPRGSGGSTGGGARAPATPGKQSSLGGRGDTHIGTAHFHGVRDPRAMHRQLAALDRRIRSARDGALHDIG